MNTSMTEERKRELRKQCGQARCGLAPGERAFLDERIAQRLVALDAFRDAHLVLTYLSFGSEVDTRGIVERAWACGKAVALPRCKMAAHELDWYLVDSFDGLERSSLGMEEPQAEEGTRLGPDDLLGSLAIVPGLSFDAAGDRLGYGGGFYDRFLAGYPGVSVGLCRECQLSDGLQAAGVIEAHDRPVDIVVSELRVFAKGHEVG